MAREWVMALGRFYFLFKELITLQTHSDSRHITVILEIYMDINTQVVTRNNFWQAYREFENNTQKNSLKKLGLSSSFSFCLSIIYRLIVSFNFFPSLVILILLALESYSNGLTETIEILVVSLQPIINGASADLIQAWLVLGLVIFVCSWIFKPWKSPAKHMTEDLMYRWWLAHGEKTPGISGD
jgi:hypothetical protein